MTGGAIMLYGDSCDLIDFNADAQLLPDSDEVIDALPFDSDADDMDTDGGAD